MKSPARFLVCGIIVLHIRTSLGFTVQARNVAANLKNSLEEMTEMLTNYRKITEKFESMRKDAFKHETRNGDLLRREFIEGIETLFKSKIKVVKEIQKRAQTGRASYKFNPSIDKFEYFNTREVDPNDNVSLKIEKTFSDDVMINLTNSFVHVPTNIFSGSSDVLNNAQWTKTLDDVFISNYRNDTSLLYQYYGDASGVLRMYPGNLNKNGDVETDLYDCRRRAWYIQASSSPKDIVLMIDASGSMIGNNIGIAKIAAASLIDTLQEDDYFNVITINKQVTYVEPCAKHLIQATKENKERMKWKIQQIDPPKDITDIDMGMKEAFSILLESNSYYNRTSADCNQAIMLITDGIEGDYAGKKVFEQRNKKKSVRAFAFLVGRVKNPSKQALLDMVCDNRGYFYEIQTLGNVWNTVLDYVNVFSRPISVLKKNILPTFSPIYRDSTGVGMVMTVSLGVVHDKKLIGVAGTDIALSTLLNIIPEERLGVFSRVFVVNGNGFTLIHPKLRAQTGYLPLPANIYFDDIERAIESNDTENLKIEMLDRIENEVTFETYTIYDDMRRVKLENTTYYFDKINDTKFSAAVAIANTDSHYFSIAKEDKNVLLDGIMALVVPFINTTNTNLTITNWTYVQTSPWNYCNNKDLDFQAQYKAALEKDDESNLVDEVLKNCDTPLVKLLLTTAAVVDEYTSKLAWQSGILENTTWGVDSLFVLTSGGFSKFLTNNNISKPLDADIFKNGIYQIATAILSASIVVVSSRTIDEFSMENFMIIAGVSRVNIDVGTSVLTSISGANISNTVLLEKFKEASVKTDCFIEPNSNESSICAIIDINGYIVVSNQGGKYDGRFIGEIMGDIVKSFVKEGLFREVMLNDTQAQCEEPDEYDSASSILLTPAKLIFELVKALCGTTYWIVVQMFLLIVSMFERNVQSSEIPKIDISCTKEMPFYLFDEQAYHGKPPNAEFKLDCDRQGGYRLAPIENTNLLVLLVRTSNLQCRKEKVTLEPKKQESNALCGYTQRYSKNSIRCFNATTDGEKDHCGAASGATPTSLLILFALTLGIVFNNIMALS